ncbi:MAG TPA: TetR/AcrR family transcriptional regulator [Candidatus Deferrimicrobium sp.]|nr:TetR/AcrR family transcriptional regulator [Candidatus Deferrimicrobium sp.]
MFEMQAALSRRERKKQETREKIYHTALTLFRIQGFEKTSVDQITSRADVGKGTFYNYFPTKEAVIYQYTREINREILDRNRDRLGQMSKAGDRLYFVLESWARFIQGHPEVAFVMAQESSALVEQEPVGSLEEILVGIIGAGQIQGEMRQDLPPVLLAQSILAGAVRQFIDWYRYKEPGGLEEKVKLVVKLFLEGTTVL